MKRLSRVTNGLIGQPMFKLLAQVKEMERAGKEIIHFEIGDPNFSSPDSVSEACKLALDRGQTHYTNSMGLWELRKEICTFAEKGLGFRPSIDQVLIIPANAIIDFVIRCVVNPGEEVIYPDPGFPTYYSVLNYAGMRPVPIPLKEENDFRMDPEDIRKSVTDRTRLIIINSPNNPTGSVMTKEEVDEVARIAEEHDIYLLTDEVYSSVIYDKVHYSPSLKDQCKLRTISLNSFSKIYSMSGWRLGYAIGPEKVIVKMGLLLQTIISCLPAFIQHGGIAALTSCQKLVEERNLELKRRRDILINGLNSISGVSALVPDGAFYTFVNIKETGLSGQELMELLLSKANVALLDGRYFGKYGDGYLRLCYASTPINMIKEAIVRMKKTIEKECFNEKRAIKVEK